MEEWKSIQGYEGLYEVSNLGRVRTAEGKTSSSARFPVRVWKQRILKQNINRRTNGGKNSKNDLMVDLWKDGKRSHLSVARLVAFAWCDGYQEGMTVNHKDGNPENNNAENLEWLTHRDNVLHAFRTGLIHSQKPCTLVNQNGEKINYCSRSEASRSIGRNAGYIEACIKNNRPVRSVSGDVYGLG